MPTPGVVLDGVREYEKAMRRAAKETRRGVVATLRPVVKRARDRARGIAEGKGLRDSGALIRGIGYFARTSGDAANAGITSKATRDDYPYPGIYEYAGATHRSDKKGGTSLVANRSAIGAREIARAGLGSGTRGPRAFLNPAMDEASAQAVHDLEELMGRICANVDKD
jgi:hypothetical protein